MATHRRWKTCASRLCGRLNKIQNKFILAFLRQRDSEQFQSCWRGFLANIVGEPGVPSEAKIKVIAGKLIEASIFEALQLECMNRFYFVPFCAQCRNKLS